MRDARPAPRADAPAPVTGSISGIVLIDDGTNRPIRQARVTIGAADVRAARITVTDDSGRFTIARLPAGRYVMSVSKAAYIMSYASSSQSGRGPGSVVTLAAGQALSDVTLRMRRGAVIEGTVRTESGEPVPGILVQVMKYQWVDDERRLRSTVSATTDDRGMYRAFGLTAGSYVIAATPSQQVGEAEMRQLSQTDIQAALADLRQTPPATSGAVSRRRRRRWDAR